jgi:hypothetical protein
MNWPTAEYTQRTYIGTNYQPPTKSGGGVAVLAISCLAVFAVAFALISNNSVSAKPIDISPASSQQQTLSKTYSVDKVSESQPSISVISATPDTSKPPAAFNAVTNEISVIDVNPSNEGNLTEAETSFNVTNSYTPTRSTYLEALWPGWGHCSGGSCRNVTNPQ